MADGPTTVEHARLAASEARDADWKHWGPYISDRAWGTVREDYSPSGDAWTHFPHDHARSRAYRWSEDAIGGVCNRFQNICLGVALWNERDPYLKERFFGLTGPEGNHGEDVKEYYFYLDSTPTHSYMKMLYKYPQVEYPYEELVQASYAAGRSNNEIELMDLLKAAFEQNRYFDVVIEYAKADPEDLLCRITVINRGSQPAPVHVLPHLWYRNTWSWGYSSDRPIIEKIGSGAAVTKHRRLGQRWWYVQSDGKAPPLLFTENETNQDRLFGVRNSSPYVKDGIHDAVIDERANAVNPAGKGSKAAAHAKRVVAPGESFTTLVRFSPRALEKPFADAERIFTKRIAEADEFYESIHSPSSNEDDNRIQRQAFAGLMWTKQFYHYSVELWLDGDESGPRPPSGRGAVRNGSWRHLYNLDVISMPDKWEYPWFAAWDLAFHCLPIAMIDPEWAKRQLVLMLREWYTHPNGQIPAYEWNFSDVNPPVHAWACWRVYQMARKQTGKADIEFLEEVFHKLLLNFTWWVNRKDDKGRNVFQGGFLGLDNIGVFDRSAPLPGLAYLEQADGTAWMGMYCLNMLAIALELARHRRAYESVATKFFEHFVYIAAAINAVVEPSGLWHEEDGFYYDQLRSPHGQSTSLQVRSFVGLIPLYAVETLEPDLLEVLPQFRRRMEWFLKYRPGLLTHIASLATPGEGGRRLLSLVDRHKLERILPRMLDPSQFLSDYGLRSLSRMHGIEPFVFNCEGKTYQVSYEPAESSSYMFGGNSNWRGPIWWPVNYLMIESLQKYAYYYGDSLRAEMPRYSENWMTLDGVASELSQRLINLFRPVAPDGGRPVFGGNPIFNRDQHWRNCIPFHEYFHGEDGAGLGASHQTGWTALVAKLIQQTAEERGA